MVLTKDIIGYEGYYKITSTGRIIRLPRERKFNGGKTKMLKRKYLKIPKQKYYPYVMLNKDGVQRCLVMHRLMAIHFIPNDDPINKREVNHIDYDITNYKLNNLEWCTRSDNVKHGKNQKNRKEKLSITKMDKTYSNLLAKIKTPKT